MKIQTKIYAPIDGEILEVNVELEDEPDMINKDPYKKGWIIKLCKITRDFSDLLQAPGYQDLIQ